MKKIRVWISVASIGMLSLGLLTACSGDEYVEIESNATTQELQELSKEEQQEVFGQIEKRGIPTLNNLEEPVKVKIGGSLNYKESKPGAVRIEVPNFVCAELDETHDGFDEYVEANKDGGAYIYRYNKDSGWGKTKKDVYVPTSSQYFIGDYITFTSAAKDKNANTYIVFGYDCMEGKECGEDGGLPYALTLDEKYRPLRFQYATFQDDNGAPFTMGATFEWGTKESCTIPEDVKNSAVEVD